MQSLDGNTTVSVHSPVDKPITSTSPDPCLAEAPVVEDVVNSISTSDPDSLNRPPKTPECAKFVGKVRDRGIL